MDYTLNDILKGVVVLPYDEDTVNLIDEATRSYEGDGDKYYVMDELMNYFFCGVEQSEFTEHINTALAGNKTITKLPSYIMRRIALYKVYIEVDETDDELEQVVLSSAFMNYLVLYKSNFDSLPIPEIVYSFYRYHLAAYFKQNDTISISNDTNIIAKIADEDFTINNLGEDEIGDLRMITKEAFLFRSEKIFNNESIQTEKDSFVRVFKAVKEYIQKADYLYYNISFLQFLPLIINKKEEEDSKELASIINSLKQNNAETNELVSSSSIILRLIAGQTVPGSAELLNKQFSLEELTVYLYYEFLIERIIKDYLDNGK